MNIGKGASSSSGRAASPARGAASTFSTSPAFQPVSPLTAVRAVRTQLSALESAFRFPAVLDFDHSELAVSATNAPVRAHEHALNALLEQLDAIESDGDEEIRDVRREVVREVERALEDVERKVREQARQVPGPEVTKEEVKGYDVQSEESSPQDLAPVDTPADADVDLAISVEYQSPSAVAESSEVRAAELDGATLAPSSKGEALTVDAVDSEAVPVSEDASDSVATITASHAPPAASPANITAPASPAPETFLTSISHDQFTFPPKPSSYSASASASSEAHDDAVLVDDSSEGGSLRSVEDAWSEVDA